jgi:hypothetical protein
MNFWFEFASTYSYPAAMRIEALAAERGVDVRWRAFLLGPIFRAQGWNDSPFNLYPAKGRYMWRDLERICSAQGIPFNRPSVFPRNGLLAARVACLAPSDKTRKRSSAPRRHPAPRCGFGNNQKRLFGSKRSAPQPSQSTRKSSGAMTGSKKPCVGRQNAQPGTKLPLLAARPGGEPCRYAIAVA